MKLQVYVRNRTTGAPVAGLAVPLKRHSDNSVVTSATSDSNGFVTFLVDGHPGDVFAEITQGGETRIVSSRTTGPTGFFQAGEAGEILQVLGSGVVSGVANALVVAPGSGLAVSVGTGLALLANHQYRQYAARTLILVAADATNPRIDLIVARVARTTGVSLVTVLTGLPAATPVVPPINQNATFWDEALAQVLVGAGATTLSADRVTDRRRYATTLVGDGAITAEKLAAGAVGSVAIAPDTVMASHIAANAVGPSEIASGAVSTDELALLAVTEDRLATAVQTKLNASGTPAANSLTTAMYQNLSVTEAKLATSVATKLNAAGGNQTIDVYGFGAGLLSGNPSTLDFNKGLVVTLNATDNIRIEADQAPIIRATPAVRDGQTLNSTTSTTGVAVLSTTITIPNDGRTYDVLAWGSLGFFNSVNVWSGIQLSVGGTGAGYVGGAGATYRDKSQQLTVLDVAPGSYSVQVALKTASGTVNYDGGQVAAVAVPR